MWFLFHGFNPERVLVAEWPVQFATDDEWPFNVNVDSDDVWPDADFKLLDRFLSDGAVLPYAGVSDKQMVSQRAGLHVEGPGHDVLLSDLPDFMFTVESELVYVLDSDDDFYAWMDNLDLERFVVDNGYVSDEQLVPEGPDSDIESFGWVDEFQLPEEEDIPDIALGDNGDEDTEMSELIGCPHIGCSVSHFDQRSIDDHIDLCPFNPERVLVAEWPFQFATDDVCPDADFKLPDHFLSDGAALPSVDELPDDMFSDNQHELVPTLDDNVDLKQFALDNSKEDREIIVYDFDLNLLPADNKEEEEEITVHNFDLNLLPADNKEEDDDFDLNLLPVDNKEEDKEIANHNGLFVHEFDINQSADDSDEDDALIVNNVHVEGVLQPPGVEVPD